MNSSQWAMRLTAMISSRVACGLCEGDVLGDRAIEQEVVLQHDAEVLAEVAQLDVSPGRWPSTITRPGAGG